MRVPGRLNISWVDDNTLKIEMDSGTQTRTLHFGQAAPASSRNTYSENAVLTEYFAAHSDFGTDYMTVVTSIEDGGNPRIVSSTFKKEPNGSKFKPTGCEVAR